MTAVRLTPSTPGSVTLLAAAVLLALPGTAGAQFRILPNGEAVIVVPGDRRAADARAVPQAANAIGDAWWDEAAPGVGADAGGEAGDDGGKPAADAKAMARQRAQARLAGVRRNRGMQILKRELSLIRASCPTLDREARTAILEVGFDVIDSQAAGRTPLVNGMEAELLRAIEQAAGGPAAAAYRAELEARGNRKRETAIAVLVAAIDAEAELSAAERAAVAASLEEQWRPEWESVVSTALRQQVTSARLPEGVVDVAAGAVEGTTLTAWRERAGEGGP
jgi:hypothetical protein